MDLPVMPPVKPMLAKAVKLAGTTVRAQIERLIAEHHGLEPKWDAFCSATVNIRSRVRSMGARIGRPARPRQDLRLAYDYSRYSTDKQESVDEQQAINKEVAADHDVSIMASFADEAVSRSIGDRPGLMAMQAAFRENPEVKYLIVNELERLTAGAAQRVQIASMCKSLGITILTEDVGAIDPHDEQKMIEADDRAIRSKAEVIKIRRRTRRNLRQKVIAGTIARRPPYGVRMKPLIGPDGEPLPSGVALLDDRGRKIRSGELELHPDEYPWLSLIFEKAGEGMSFESIARWLTDQGVPTKTGNVRWRPNTIAGILSNPFYKGQLIWGLRETREDAEGKTYLEMREEGDSKIVVMDSPLGALVDPKLWERLALDREERQGERRTNPRRPMDGFIYCGRCHRKMYGRNDVHTMISKARRQGKPTEQWEGRVLWRYFCGSGRAGVTLDPGLPPVCTSVQTASERSILESLEKAALVAAGAVIEPDAVGCRTCEVEPGMRCRTKSGKPFWHGPEGYRNTHQARVEVMEWVNARVTGKVVDGDLVVFSAPAERDIEVERRIIKREKARLEGLLETQQALAVEGLVPVEMLRVKKAELDHQIAVQVAKEEALDKVGPVSPEARKEMLHALGSLAALLRDDAFPIDHKVATMARTGISRLYVDGPAVKIQLA